MRRVRRWTAAFLLVGLLLTPSPAPSAPALGPFADVPPSHWAYGAINEAAALGMFNGYADQTFQVKRALTRYEFAVVIQRVFQDIANRRPDGRLMVHCQGPPSPFTDVPSDHWAYDAVAQLAAQGICNGFHDRSFRGHQPMTRYEVAVAIERVRQDILRWWTAVRSAPILPPKPAHASPFKDVSQTHWAAADVRTLHEEIGTDQGILAGYPDDTFHGQQTITRAEFAALFQRLLMWFSRLGEIQPKQAPKAKAPVSWPSTLSPHSPHLLFPIAALSLSPSPAPSAPALGPFADIPPIHWAYDAVNELAALGVFNGYPDQTFQGKRPLTRYEFAVALQRQYINWEQRNARSIARLILRCQGPRSPFTDVPSDHWAWDAVNELTGLGIFNGYLDQSFRGNQPMTRYEIAVAVEMTRQDLLRRVSAHWPTPILPPKPAHSPPLTDVPQSHWAAPYVRTLHDEIGTDQGILAGYPDGTFRGRQALARAEFAGLFQRLLTWVQDLIEIQPKPAPKAKTPVSLPNTPSPHPHHLPIPLLTPSKSPRFSPDVVNQTRAPSV